jgi:hypothetical protein
MYQITVKDRAFNVDARTKKEALHAVADYLFTFNQSDYFKTASDFSPECDIGDNVEDYAASLGFYRYGTRGIYVPVASVREVAR